MDMPSRLDVFFTLHGVVQFNFQALFEVINWLYKLIVQKILKYK